MSIRTIWFGKRNRRTAAGGKRFGINMELYLSIFIPMLGKADSLNVGVATLNIAYKISKQFNR